VLINITPNHEKAKSILKMVDSTLEMVQELDPNRFPSNITKEYYDIIRELISIILLLDGYKTVGEGAHKEIIEYLGKNYKDFSNEEISLIDELRRIRNKISYDGFFVTEDYVERKKDFLLKIIDKLKREINSKW